MPEHRRRLALQVAEPYRLDRDDFAKRFQNAVDFERSSYRNVHVLTEVPLRQISAIANARPTMDWAHYAILLWLGEVEDRMKRHFASLEARRMTRFEREAAKRLGEEVKP